LLGTMPDTDLARRLPVTLLAGLLVRTIQQRSGRSSR
jgi:hypothetical protein